VMGVRDNAAAAADDDDDDAVRFQGHSDGHGVSRCLAIGGMSPK